MPHNLAELILERYHEDLNDVKGYFGKISIRFTVNGQETKWQSLAVGIITGCTISVILFTAAMNIMLKSVEKKNRGPSVTEKIRQPPTRAFMDNMTLTTMAVVEGRWLLEDLGITIHWA
jgi:hypothetical protein